MIGMDISLAPNVDTAPAVGYPMKLKITNIQSAENWQRKTQKIWCYKMWNKSDCDYALKLIALGLFSYWSNEEEEENEEESDKPDK
jgi:hypothetical protein